MDSFCPYIDKALRFEFSTNQDNDLVFRTRPCCHMHGGKFDNQYKKWQVCNTWQDLESHDNRLYFLDWQKNTDKLHDACHPCIEVEKHNPTKSPRFIFPKETVLDYHILDVVVGNTCNLACPFCAPNVSSLIEKITSGYKDRSKLPGKWSHDPEVNGNPSKVAKVVADFLKNRNIGELKIIGGEPLLAENWTEIGKVIDQGLCSDTTLVFTTNGTVMNEKIIKNLKQVKDSKVTVSIDSIGSNYDFIRWPYKYNKVQQNVDYLIDQKPNSTWVNVDGLVTIINFEFLPDIIGEFKRWPSFSFMFDLKPDGSELDYKVLSKDIINQVYKNINFDNVKKQLEFTLDNYDDLNMSYLKSKTKNSLEWFLKQRRMDKTVLGENTLKYLGM